MDKKRIEAAVREILAAVGEDPDREGLVETPERVARMYEEIFSGLEDDPKRHVKLFNEEKNEELVIVRDIPMYSMCEHHLLPFIGRAHIAYIPRDGRVIGLSKLSRVVDSFARRPQLQERLTSQIADFLDEQLDPLGVAVVIEAEHLCMTMRGARASGRRREPPPCAAQCARTHGRAPRQYHFSQNKAIPWKILFLTPHPTRLCAEYST